MDLVEIMILQHLIILLSPPKSPCPIGYTLGYTLLLFPYWSKWAPLQCSDKYLTTLRAFSFGICYFHFNPGKRLAYLKACLLFQTTLVCPIRDTISAYRLCPAFYHSYILQQILLTETDIVRRSTRQQEKSKTPSFCPHITGTGIRFSGLNTDTSVVCICCLLRWSCASCQDKTRVRHTMKPCFSLRSHWKLRELTPVSSPAWSEIGYSNLEKPVQLEQKALLQILHEEQS